jgi:thiol-disulfide isomerase/thioredoxin
MARQQFDVLQIRVSNRSDDLGATSGIDHGDGENRLVNGLGVDSRTLAGRAAGYRVDTLDFLPDRMTAQHETAVLLAIAAALLVAVACAAVCPAAEIAVPVTAEVQEPFTGLCVFTASWCQPCRTMKPTIAKLQAEGMAISIIDIDARPRAARAWGVKQVPTTMALHRLQKRRVLIGPATEQQLRELYQEAVKP